MRIRIQTVPKKVRIKRPCDVVRTVVADEDLRPGDTVEFQFPNSWSLTTGPSFTREFQTEDPQKEHFIGVAAPGATFTLDMRKRHLNFFEGVVRHGRHFIATLARGAIPAGRPIQIRYLNTFAPFVAERETVWLRVRGVAPECSPVLHTTAGPHQSFRVIVPSGAEPGQAFDVLIVSLDAFDNASSTRFAGEKLQYADGTLCRAGIAFTGCARIPVRLDAEGIYRFRFRGTVSNTLRVARGGRGPYWGDLHIHTKLSHDAQGNDPYGYAREVSGLDFACAADHWNALGEEGYQTLLVWAEAAHEPGRFVALLGDERIPRRLMGHHNLYFREPDAFYRHRALPGQGSKASDEDEAAYLQRLNPDEALCIPHHTGQFFGSRYLGEIGEAIDLDAWDDRGLRPVMEIYSHHGQSELYDPQHALAYEVSRMRRPERRANASVPGPYYAQNYWMAGRRLGVFASSDEHSGQGGRRHGGIAAIYAAELTRAGIFAALRRRRCYGTTGERILIEFTIDGTGMGEAVRCRPGAKLKIGLRVWGTATLLRVEILRYRFNADRQFLPVISDSPRPEAWEAAYELEDDAAVPSLYYARVTQEPIEWPDMAWSSPIWIDALGKERREDKRS